MSKSNKYGYSGVDIPTQAFKSNVGKFDPAEINELVANDQWTQYGQLELIETQTYSSAVSFVDFTDIKQDIYNVHFITMTNAQGSNAQVQMQFYEGGVLETASVYDYAIQFCASNGTFLELKSSTAGHIQIGNSTNDAQNGYIYCYNLGDSTKYSFSTSHYIDDDSGDSRSVAMFGSGMLPQKSEVNGIRLKLNSGNYDSFTFSIYGIKEYS